MRGGDISNSVVPRMWWLWEGLVATLPENKRQLEWACRKAHRWERAVRQWEWSDHIEKLIWDLFVRFDTRSDLVTVRGVEFSKALAKAADDHNLPCQVIHYPNVHALAKAAGKPYVHTVYFGIPELVWTFGSTGRLVQNGGRGFSPLV